MRPDRHPVPAGAGRVACHYCDALALPAECVTVCRGCYGRLLAVVRQPRPATEVQPAPPVFYTPAEVGALVGVGADTVRDWLAAGRLDAVPLGEPKGRQGVRWRVPRAGLAAFLRGRKRTA